MTLTGNENYIRLDNDAFRDECIRLWTARHLPRMLFAVDETNISGGLLIYAVFSSSGSDNFTIPYTVLEGDQPELKSLTPDIPAFHWYEREIRDMFGIKLLGHPDPRPLVLHACYGKGIHPLRRDSIAGDIRRQIDTSRADDYPFMRVDGEGVCEIPVGPVHAGIIEPGHFRFSAVGESIYFLDPRLFYVHKGIEKHFETLGFEKGVELAERVSGVGTAAHASAYCQAVERMSGIDVPVRAKAGRTVLLELERLYNHIGDIANMCAGTGFAVGYARGVLLREELQELNEKVTGNRFLRGALCIGGLRIDVLNHMEDILPATGRVHDEFRKYMKFLTSNTGHKGRLENTGILAKETARYLGATGPAARASGISDDIRVAHPHLAYDSVTIEPNTRNSGDVFARLRVRADEVECSSAIIEEILSNMPDGDICAKSIMIAPDSKALGYTEGPRGSVFYFVQSDGQGNPVRVKLRSASFCNWPLMPFAVHGNIVPDFPLINKSFNLSYSGCDM